jgi:hypothetical protein
VDVEDRPAGRLRRWGHLDVLLDPARAQEGGIERLGPVRRGEHHQAGIVGEPVDLGE